jgi:hypothetical protein
LMGNKYLFLKEDIERFIREEQEKRAAKWLTAL